MTIRLHKWLAEQGIASRRQAEQLIADGKVRVNNQPAHIGQVIDPKKDKVLYNRKRVLCTVKHWQTNTTAL